MRKKLAALGTAAALLIGGAVTAAPAQAAGRCVELTWQSHTDINVLTNYVRNEWTNVPKGRVTCSVNLGGFYVPKGYRAELTQGLNDRKVGTYYQGDHLYALRATPEWRYRIYLHRI